MLIFAKVSTSSFVKVFDNAALSPTLNEEYLLDAHFIHCLVTTYSENSLEIALNPLAFIALFTTKREVTSKHIL